MFNYVIVFVVLCSTLQLNNTPVKSVGINNVVYLEQYMDQLASSKAGEHCDLNGDLSEQVDFVFQKLDKALDGKDGRRLAAGLKEATALDKLLIESQTQSPKPQPKPRPSYSQNKGLLGILDDDSAYGKNVVSARRVIDFQALTQDVSNQLKRLPKGEKKALLEAASELVVIEEGGEQLSISDSMRGTRPPMVLPFTALLRTAKSVAALGFEVLDKFYCSFEFFASLPIIGQELRKIKEQRQPFFKVIESMRHVHYLFKLRNHRETLSGVIDSRQTRAAKKVLSDVGTKALKSIVQKTLKLVTHLELKEDHVQEFLSRAFYAGLSSVVSSSRCTLSR